MSLATGKKNVRIKNYKYYVAYPTEFYFLSNSDRKVFASHIQLVRIIFDIKLNFFTENFERGSVFL